MMDVITFKFYNVLINISRMGQITSLILVKSTGQKRVKRAYALSMIRFLSMAMLQPMREDITVAMSSLCG